MTDRIIKVKPGYWVKVQHRTSWLAQAAGDGQRRRR